MKTIEIPTMTKDEIDMLDGLSGQMSDGAGENCSWCSKYWPHMKGFENKDGKSYFTFQELGAFKDKADDEIIKDIGMRFNQICKKLNEVPDCGPELFYDDERRDKLQHEVARSVVKKLTGKDSYHTPTMEDHRMACLNYYGHSFF